MRLPPDSDIRRARRLVVVVGLAYLAAELLALSLDRPPSWDEAIYLSQVTPDADPLPFVPYRARGITFLAIPVLQLGGSLAHLRLFLTVASAAALTASFRMWCPVIGYGAVAAALLFAGAWPALFYGSELMPNMWVALTAGAATAVLARRFAGREGRTDELVAGGLVAVAALMRPLDAVVLTAALVLLPIVFGRATISWTVHVALGLVAGWAPWLVEMTARFGSPGEAFAAAARLSPAGGGSPLGNLRRYLALSDGPTMGSAATHDLPVTGLLWFLGMAILVVLGIRAATHRNLLPSVVAATAVGVAFASEYVVGTDAQAPRFLLPALALFAIPAGLGLATIVAGRSARDGSDQVRFAGRAVASLLVIAWTVAQIGIGASVEADVTSQRGSADRAGLRIRALAGEHPCHVYSEAHYPIVAYAAGCRGGPIGKVVGVWPERAARLDGNGIRPFLVLHRMEQPAEPEGAVLLAEIPSDGHASWFVYGIG
jgi:hypothetical protein